MDFHKKIRQVHSFVLKFYSDPEEFKMGFSISHTYGITLTEKTGKSGIFAPTNS